MVATVGRDGVMVRELFKPRAGFRHELEFDTDGKSLFFTIATDEADVAVVSLKRR